MASTSLVQQKQNLETYSLIWLDAVVNSSQENLLAQQQLRTSINHLLIFADDNECEDYIRSTPTQDRIIFIVSGRLGQKIVPRTHQLQQLFSIYVYCSDKRRNSQWSQQFSKVILEYHLLYQLSLLFYLTCKTHMISCLPLHR
jgi:hypothetical protein